MTDRSEDAKTPHYYQSDVDFCDFINGYCVGKTIAKATPLDRFMVKSVQVEFTDGTGIVISGENDEGFIVDAT